MNEENRISLSSLILARLLPRGGKGETPAGIRNGLQPLAGRRWDGAGLLKGVKEKLDQLQEEGLVDLISSKGPVYALTEKGILEAASSLGLGRIPKRITWVKIRDTYLFAKALGIDPSYFQKRGLDGARAVVLARELGLPWRPSSTLTSVLDAYLARTLELRSRPQHALRPALISLAVTFEDEAAPVMPEQQAFDLHGFARDVLRAAARCETGWFGNEKVFISHVWTSYAERSGGGIGDMDVFKSRLVEAHRADLLTLAGADLVEAMDPEDVAASETCYLNGSFHFVRLRRDQ